MFSAVHGSNDYIRVISPNNVWRSNSVWKCMEKILRSNRRCFKSYK